MKGGTLLSKVFILMMLLFILVGNVFSPLLATTNIVLAADDKSSDSKKEDKSTGDAEEDKAGYSGSTANNLNNVLGMDKATMDESRVKKISSALEYNHDVAVEMTKRILISDVMASSEYSKIYNGLGKDFKFDTKVSMFINSQAQDESDTSIGLEDKGKKLPNFEEFKKSKDYKKVFGDFKGKNEKDVYDKIVKGIAQGNTGVENLKNDAVNITSKSFAKSVCNTSYAPSTYGGLVRVEMTDEYTNTTLLTDRYLYLHTANETIDYSHPLSSKVHKRGMWDDNDTGDIVKDSVNSCENIISTMVNGKDSGTEKIPVRATVDTLIDKASSKEGGYTFSNTKKDLQDMVSNIKKSGANKLSKYYKPSYNRIEEYKFYGALSTDATGLMSHYTKYSPGAFRVQFGSTQIDGKDESIHIYSQKSDENKEMSKKDIQSMIDEYNKIFNKNITMKTYGDLGFQGFVSALNGVTEKRFKHYSDNKEFQKMFEDNYLKELKNTPYAILRANQDVFGNIKGSIEDSGNIKGLGWVPLYMNGIKDDKKITDLAEKFDGSMITSDSIEVSSGRRNVQVYDLFAIEKDKKYSPFLADGTEGVVVTGTSGRKFNKLTSHSGLKYSDEKISEQDDKKASFIGYSMSRNMFTDSKAKGSSQGNNALGVDNYGNIVSAVDLGVVIPYWQNDEVYKGKEKFYSHPYLKLSGNTKIGGGGGGFSDKLTADEIVKLLKKGDLSDDKLTKLAERIVGLSEKDLKEYNKEFIDSYEKDWKNGNGELFLGSASLDSDKDDEASDLSALQEEFTDADLKKKIAMMLKYGATDFIRLTFVGLFVDFYNTVAYNFAISSVFYTTTIADTQFFKDSIPLILSIIGAITLVYVAISAIRISRGLMTWGRFLTVFTMLTFMILMPYVYQFVIHKGINDVSDTMLGRQTRQMFVLDSQKKMILDTLNQKSKTLQEDQKNSQGSEDVGSEDTSSDSGDTKPVAGTNGNEVSDTPGNYCVKGFTFANYQSSPEFKTSKKFGGTTLQSVKMMAPQSVKYAEAVAKEFPKLKTLGGWRGCDGQAPDHPSGLAVDVMVNDTKSGVSTNNPDAELGTKIAEWTAKNMESLGVNSFIWQDKWYDNGKRKYPNGKPLGTSGGNTVRHFDHVHVEMKKGSGGDGTEVSSSDSETTDNTSKSDGGITTETSAELELMTLFGASEGLNLRDVSQDYTVELFTTTTVDGCKIDETNLTPYCLNKIGDKDWTMKKWDKSDLVSVKVSVFDIYKWLETIDEDTIENKLDTTDVENIEDKNKGVDKEKENDLKKKEVSLLESNKAYADESVEDVANETNRDNKNGKESEEPVVTEENLLARNDRNIPSHSTLFNFLASMENSEARGYSELTDYTEYQFNKTKVLKGIGKDNESYESDTIAASELLMELYHNANSQNLFDNLKMLDVVREKSDKGEMSNVEKESVIRDLSMTGDARTKLYGNFDELSEKSKLALGSKTVDSTDSDVKEDSKDVKKETVVTDVDTKVKVAEVSSGDLFSLQSTLEGLSEYRTPFTTTLNQDIFDINKRVSNMYINEIAPMNQIIGEENGATNTLIKAQKQVLMMNVWFETNKEFGFDLFPKALEGDTVSLDNYMRVAFIPLGKFAGIVENDFTSSQYVNVGHYISLRDNIMVLMVFSLALILLVIYGMIKWAVLGFVLLAITIYAFVKNYMLSYNKDNKMWLGAGVLYGTFILSNIVFNGMWWAFGYALNKSYLNNHGEVGYNATLIHSGITIAVLAFIIFYVFRKLFDKVRKDIDNLGGQEFKDSYDKIKSKVTGAMNNLKSKVKIGESYSQDSKKEGASGYVTDDDVMSLSQQESINARLQNAESSEASDMVLNGIKDELKAQTEGGAYNNIKSIINNNSVEGKSTLNTLKDFDKIEASNLNDEEYEGYGLEGKKIAGTGDGENIYGLGFGNTESGNKQADMLSDYLTKKGVNNVLDGAGNVVFDAGMHDMSTPGGRKELLGDFVMDSITKVKDKDKLSFGSVDSSALNNNFDYNVNADGTIDLGISEENGIHPQVLAKIRESNLFKDNFQVIKGYNGDGKPGTLKVKFKDSMKGEPVENREAKLAQLFNMDTTHRKSDNGLELRKESDAKELLRFDENNKEFAKILDKEFNRMRKTETGAKKLKGMVRHSDKLVFDGDNEYQRKFVEDVRAKYLKNAEGDLKDAQIIAQKVGSYVVNGKGKANIKKKHIQAIKDNIELTQGEDGESLFNVDDSKEYTKNGEYSGDYQDTKTTGTDEVINNSKGYVSKLFGNNSKAEVVGKVFSEANKVKVSSTEGRKKVKAAFKSVGKQAELYANLIADSGENLGNGLKETKIDKENTPIMDILKNKGLFKERVSRVVANKKVVDNVNGFNEYVNSLQGKQKQIDDYREQKQSIFEASEKGLEDLGTHNAVDSMLAYMNKNQSYRKDFDKYAEEFRNYTTGVLSPQESEKGKLELFNKMKSDLTEKGTYQDLVSQIGMEKLSPVLHTYNSNIDINKFIQDKVELEQDGIDLNKINKLGDKEYSMMMDFVSGNNAVKGNTNGTIDIVESDDNTKTTHKFDDESNKELFELIKKVSA